MASAGVLDLTARQFLGDLQRGEIVWVLAVGSGRWVRVLAPPAVPNIAEGGGPLIWMRSLADTLSLTLSDTVNYKVARGKPMCDKPGEAWSGSCERSSRSSLRRVSSSCAPPGRLAARAMMAGFTALRVLGTEGTEGTQGTGGADFADESVQQAIKNGLIPGPHLHVATRATIGAHCYGPGPMGFRDDLVLPQGGIPLSGTAQMNEGMARQPDE